MRNRHCAISTYNNEGVKAKRSNKFKNLGRYVSISTPVVAKGVCFVAGAQYGATKCEDATDVSVVEWLDAFFNKPLESIFEAKDFCIVLYNQTFDYSPDYRIQAGAISASGNNTNA